MDSIIFDVDGTLWDSTKIVAESWTRVIASQTDLNLVITSDRLHQLFGQQLPHIARQIFPNETPRRQLELIDLCCEEEHRQLLKTPAPPYPGVEQMLKTLSEKYPLYIVSNCQAGYVEVFLESTGLSRYFTDHLCPGDTGNPKAENILTIMNRHQLHAPVYVGDTMGDYHASQKAGIPFIFASYGFGEVPDAQAAIASPMDLIRLCLHPKKKDE